MVIDYTFDYIVCITSMSLESMSSCDMILEPYGKDEFYQNVNSAMGLKLTEFLLGYRFSSKNVCDCPVLSILRKNNYLNNSIIIVDTVQYLQCLWPISIC